MEFVFTDKVNVSPYCIYFLKKLSELPNQELSFGGIGQELRDHKGFTESKDNGFIFKSDSGGSGSYIKFRLSHKGKKLLDQINITTKELVTIEFRYSDKRDDEDEDRYVSKTITIGVFDTLDEAIAVGNKVLEDVFEKRFKLNASWDRKERFSKRGGPFGTTNRLVSDLAYLQTPFQFFFKITKLEYPDVDQTISEALEACERFKQFKLKEEEPNDGEN